MKKASELRGLEFKIGEVPVFFSAGGAFKEVGSGIEEIDTVTLYLLVVAFNSRDVHLRLPRDSRNCSEIGRLHRVFDRFLQELRMSEAIPKFENSVHGRLNF